MKGFIVIGKFLKWLNRPEAVWCSIEEPVPVSTIVYSENPAELIESTARLLDEAAGIKTT